MFTPTTKQGNYLDKYFYLREHGYQHQESKQMAQLGITKLNFNEEQYKKTILRYKLLYGFTMQIFFMITCMMVYNLRWKELIIFIILICYIYTVLMRLRTQDELYFEVKTK